MFRIGTDNLSQINVAPSYVLSSVPEDRRRVSQLLETGMTRKITSEMVSRRGAFSLFGLGAALGLTVPTVLTMSEAGAQTAGMERREDRRANRQDRREDRRANRQDRRNLYMQQK